MVTASTGTHDLASGMNSSSCELIHSFRRTIQPLRSTRITRLLRYYRPLRFPLGRSTVIDSRPALVPHHPGGPPRFLDRSVLARCLQPPRGSDPVLAHCCFASRTVSGFILVGGLADPYFHNEAESSSLALRLASSSTRGFSLSGFPSDCSLTTC